MTEKKTDPTPKPGDNTTPGSAASSPPVYRVLDPDGIEWRDKTTGRIRTARQGARRLDIPALSIPWLIKGGHIELAENGEGADPGEDEEDK